MDCRLKSKVQSHRLTSVIDDMYSPENGTVPLPSSGGRPMRSPGVRMPSATPPILEDVVSPYGDNGTAIGTRTSAPAGVKRTKSLMQKFKTMVRTRSGSVEGQPGMPQMQSGYVRGQGQKRPGLGGGQRSKSMSTMAGVSQPRLVPASPGWADRDVVEDEREEEAVDQRRTLKFVEKPRSQSVYAAAGRR
jgi:hypothetical protein